MLQPKDIQTIVDAHDDYWDGRRADLRTMKRLYMTRFWQDNGVADNVLRTEVPKAYAVVESYLGSLYAKNPAVRVEPDLRDRGTPEVAQATANQFLLAIRNQLEDATRLALIYPCAYLKLAPVESVDPLKRVSCAALPPWEVIVDATATSWEVQRWVGHVHLMPLAEAATRYSKAPEAFTGRVYTDWLDDTSRAMVGRPVALGDVASNDVDKWVRIVEVYDLRDDKLLVWSPDFDAGKSFLFEGVTVQIGALEETVDGQAPEAEFQHETTGIPYKTANGRPIVPIVPVYFARDPDKPLRGYSLVERSRDQFRELNLIRTYQAQGVRRMARQWMVRAGFLSEDAAAKISQGLDGEFIEVDTQPGQPLEGNMVPVPTAPIPGDIAAYALTVDGDIRDAGLLAPFTRGEVTKSTATEQNLLAAYTSSEIGRMARIRDEAITSVARVYNIMLSVVLGNDAEPLALPNPVGPTILSADDLTGDFGYWAVDAGTTPMSDLAKQQAFERLTPLLLQVGADPVRLLEEVVRVFQLPETLAQPAPMAEPTAEQPTQEVPSA